jgi:DUF1680 family protein
LLGADQIIRVVGADVAGADPRLVQLLPGRNVGTTERPDLLGGVTVLETEGERVTPDPAWEGRLYRTADSVGAERAEPVRITAIPYFAWANRGTAEMTVWLPLSARRK